MNLSYDYLIVGGGIAGTTAAETIRQKEPRSRIAIIENEPHLLYSRVFLPKYCKNEIGIEKVMLRVLGDYELKNLDVYLSEEAEAIDFVRQEITTASGKKFAYKKLLIASGGKAKPWEFEKEFGDRIFRLQTLEDAERLRSVLRDKKMRKVLVVGGGFISLEFLNIFLKAGLEISLLARQKYFWESHIDADGGELFDTLFSRNKINFIPGDEIISIKLSEDGGLDILTKNGRKLYADFIAAGVGLKRNFDLGRERFDVGSGLKVNEFLEALDRSGPVENIWAAGDVMEYFDDFSGRWKLVGNWTHAFFTGRLAALNMTGERVPFRGVPAYSITALGSVLTFLGEVSEEFSDETVTRYAREETKYTRFFLKKNKLIGAVMINTYQDRPVVAKLIELKKDLSDKKNLFSDSSFDLASLLK